MRDTIIFKLIQSDPWWYCKPQIINQNCWELSLFKMLSIKLSKIIFASLKIVSEANFLLQFSMIFQHFCLIIQWCWSVWFWSVHARTRVCELVVVLSFSRRVQSACCWLNLSLAVRGIVNSWPLNLPLTPLAQLALESC